MVFICKWYPNTCQVCSAGYYMQSAIPSLPSSTGPVIIHGLDSASRFMAEMKELSRQVTVAMKEEARPMVLTAADEAAMQVQRNCHICDRPLLGDEVRDHCHLTGQFRGLAHNGCNLQFRPRQSGTTGRFYIPVVFHNLKGYDGHFLVKEVQAEDRTHVIANSMEKYVSFSVGGLRFVDSMQFLPASLSRLSENCPAFTRLSAWNADPELQRKG